jgi:hypothetical protein
MNIIHKMVAVAALGSTLAFVGDSVAGDFNVVSANVCRHYNYSAIVNQEGSLNWGQYGVNSIKTDNNPNGVGLRFVRCPIVNSAEVHTSDPTSFSAIVYDRSTYWNVNCTIYRLNHDGTSSFSMLNGTSTPNWSWSSQTLTYSVPSNGGYGYNYQFDCQLPPLDAGRASHVTTFTSSR